MIVPTNKPGPSAPGAARPLASRPLSEITPFPIWAILLLIMIGMGFIVLALVAIYFKMSTWIPILCAVIAIKAIATPWIYGYFLRRIKAMGS